MERHDPARPAPAEEETRGAAGHAKADRPLVAKPDTLIEARVQTCVGCGADLRAVTPTRVRRRQITEVPELKPVVIETQQHEVCCPACHTVQMGVLPPGLEAERWFGPRLEALVTYFHQVHHIGYARLQTVLADIFGLGLSTGAAVGIVDQAGAGSARTAAASAHALR